MIICAENPCASVLRGFLVVGFKHNPTAVFKHIPTAGKPLGTRSFRTNISKAQWDVWDKGSTKNVGPCGFGPDSTTYARFIGLHFFNFFFEIHRPPLTSLSETKVRNSKLNLV